MGVNLDTGLNAQARGWGPHGQANKMKWIEVDNTRLLLNEGICELFELLMLECVRRGYTFHEGALDDWGYADRYIAGTTVWSNHSWGLAGDLNARNNPFTTGSLVTDMPKWLPDLFNEYGFRWGGDYHSVKDAMHFEFMGTPQDAREMLEKAKRLLGQEEDDMSEFVDGIELARQGKNLGDKASHDKKLGFWVGQKLLADGPAPVPSDQVPAHTHDLAPGKTKGVSP